MTLPKISHPTFKVTVPSNKKQLTFRPFLVKEEKILLMAKTSEDSNDILTAVKQTVNNCCQDPGFDVNKLTIFDLEYIFLRIRSNSVGSTVSLSFKDMEDERPYKFEVDLNKIEMVYPKNSENKIQIDDKTGIIMKYPSASLYDDRNFLKLGQDALFELMIRCVDKIYSGDEMFDPASYTHEQLSGFIDGLDVKTFEKIQEFLSNAPTMKYTLSYVNSLGNQRQIELTTLDDFFTLR